MLLNASECEINQFTSLIAQFMVTTVDLSQQNWDLSSVSQPPVLLKQLKRVNINKETMHSYLKSNIFSYSKISPYKSQLIFVLQFINRDHFDKIKCFLHNLEFIKHRQGTEMPCTWIFKVLSCPAGHKICQGLIL